MKITMVKGRKRTVRYEARKVMHTGRWTLRLGQEAYPLTLPGTLTEREAKATARRMLRVTRLPKTVKLVEI